MAIASFAFLKSHREGREVNQRGCSGCLRYIRYRKSKERHIICGDGDVGTNGSKRTLVNLDPHKINEAEH